MVLTYVKYIELMTALDEHCKCSLDKRELQSAIFNHYADKYGNFVAENYIGSKRLFITKRGQTKYNKNVRKIFIQFMNEMSRKKKINKVK